VIAPGVLTIEVEPTISSYNGTDIDHVLSRPILPRCHSLRWLLWPSPDRFSTTSGPHTLSRHACRTGESIMVWSKGRTWIEFRSGVLGVSLLLIVTFVGVSNAAATTTHYIAANGSDANNGTSKTTPWAHLPGMPGCSNSCSSYTPAAGDQFILRGGDTWGATSLGINWIWSGNSGGRIYIGVDQSYYAGASWTRPIFNCQTSTCNLNTYGNVVWIAGNYVTLDNIEFTGYQQSGGGALVAVYANNDEVENCYFHGWSRQPGATSVNSFALTNNWSGGAGIGTLFHNNVIDGSDSPNQDFMGGILHGDQVYNNVIRYVYNGMNGQFRAIYGNVVENNYVSVSGDHCNMVRVGGITSGQTLWIYNNIIRHAGCSGGSNLYALADSFNPSATVYEYNNILYDNENSFDKGITIGGHQQTGVYYVYNNTLVALTGSCLGNGEAPSTKSTVHYGNNHCISPNAICLATGTTCVNDGGNLLQTASQASANIASHFDQYTPSETYAYSPVAATNSTVVVGTNLASLCSGNVAALCSDTTYATYDSGSHAVAMRTVNARPSTGAWDIGAYQYAAGGPSPNPPSGLVAVVH